MAVRARRAAPEHYDTCDVVYDADAANVGAGAANDSHQTIERGPFANGPRSIARRARETASSTSVVDLPRVVRP